MQTIRTNKPLRSIQRLRESVLACAYRIIQSKGIGCTRNASASSETEEVGVGPAFPWHVIHGGPCSAGYRLSDRFWLATMILAGLAITLPVNAVIPASERQALLDIYTSTNGQNWTNNFGWNGAVGGECGWYGVTCDATNSHVTDIALVDNDLAGVLPSLSALPNLQLFQAPYNQLASSIPPFSGMVNLTYFSVHDNQFTGSIPSLAGLTNLNQFDVRNNQLTGYIPSLTGLTNLMRFYAGSNQLVGSLPSFAGLVNLRYFNVSENQLSGALPSLAGIDVEEFSASYNQITGSIPPIAGLANLFYYSVDHNQLTGSIPSLAGLPNLQRFDADDNHLSGSIPSLANLTGLERLRVDNNQLSGNVPDVPSPSNLGNGESALCPNALNPTPSAAWDSATGMAPWYQDCAPLQDLIFADGFDP